MAKTDSLLFFVEVGVYSAPLIFMVFRSIVWFSRSVLADPQVSTGVPGFLGMIFMLGQYWVLGFSYYDYSRYGVLETTLVIALLLTTPLYLFVEILLQIGRARKRNSTKASP